MTKYLLHGMTCNIAESLHECGLMHWYLPHHPVVNPNKEKPRIVFDCAAQHLGVSLNSRVLQGLDLTHKLVGGTHEVSSASNRSDGRRGGHVPPGTSRGR